MHRIIYDQHPAILAWAEARIGWNLPDSYTIAGEVDGVIECVAVFSRSHFDDMEISFATRSTKWPSRRYIRAVFRYVFYQLGKARCTALVLANNEKSANLVERLGFRLEGRARKVNKGTDLLIYGMLKEECRWIKQ